MHAEFFADHAVDTLILLVGSNTLPNYVAARLLAKDGGTVVLVHSKDTRQHTEWLVAELRAQNRGWEYEYLEVEEANPTHIYTQIKTNVTSYRNSLNLNYTGGTKAMAVHAWRAVNDATNGQFATSYLDARNLALVIEPRPHMHRVAELIGTRVPVDLMTMLRLHNSGDLKKFPQRSVKLPQTIHALAQVAAVDPDAYSKWTQWIDERFRRSDRRDKFHSKTALRAIPISSIPLPTVLEALRQDVPHLAPDHTFAALDAQLTPNAPFVGFDKEAAKWFEGTWLEEYVFLAVRSFAQQYNIHDAVVGLESILLKQPKDDEAFEFDVAFVRGHQLFAISVTTSHEQGICKSKLLEAAIRARKLGGDEAQVALVCFAASNVVKTLEAQIPDLTGGSAVKVFGRNDLTQLAPRLEDWVRATMGAA